METKLAANMRMALVLAQQLIEAGCNVRKIEQHTSGHGLTFVKITYWEPIKATTEIDLPETVETDHGQFQVAQ